MKTNTAWISESEKAHGENWRKWLGHLRDKPAIGLELGTWMGESAEWMLDNIFTNRACAYYCVDTFEGSDEHRLAGIDCSQIEHDTRERLARFSRAMIIKSRSDEFLRRSPRIGPGYDFIYVDAAHDALNVLRDAVLAFDLMKVGGVMIFDDYAWNVMPEKIDCPKMAVDAFVSCYGRQLEVIGLGYQVAVKKVA